MSLLRSAQHLLGRGPFISKKREDLEYGRKSLICKELPADVRLTIRIVKKVGKREGWGRGMSERGLGKRMLYLNVIYDSSRRKTRTCPPFCMWMREEKGCIFHWAENQSALREGAVKCK